MAGRKWTEAERNILVSLYPNARTSCLCWVFDRSVTAIHSQAGLIGLKKSEAHIEKMKLLSSDFLKKAGEKTRYKKGFVPKNKGKKQADYMAPEMIAKSAVTRFKKGGFSHNRLPLLSERYAKDGYLQIKIADGLGQRNWMQKSQYVWENYYGDMPEKHIIKFADGDKNNFAIDNLICVPMADNMRGNMVTDSCIVKRLFKVDDPVEIAEIVAEYGHIIEVKRLEIKLNQKIKKHESN